MTPAPSEDGGSSPLVEAGAMEDQCDCPERPRTAGVKPAWNKPAWEVGDSLINLNVNKKVEGMERGKQNRNMENN